LIASYSAEVIGLGAITYGSWSALHWIGFVVGGISLLVIGESLAPTKPKGPSKK